MAIGTVFEVWVSVLVVVVVVVVVVEVAMEIVAVLVVVVVSDSVRSLFPEVLWISRYNNDATRPGIEELSRFPECCLEECDLFRDLAMSSLMRWQVSVYVYILYLLVVDPAVWD